MSDRLKTGVRHHQVCPLVHAVDVGAVYACRCPKGWPRRHEELTEPTPAPDVREALQAADHALSLLDKVTMYGPADRVRDCADRARRLIADALEASGNAPDPAPDPVRYLRRLGRELSTQDGMGTPEGPTHATAWPIYQVEQKARIFGINPMDVDPDGYEEDEEGESFPYVERWELVQGAVSLTRGGIERYLAADRHNLNQPRIYIGSAHRVTATRRLIRHLQRLGEGATFAAPRPWSEIEAEEGREVLAWVPECGWVEANFDGEYWWCNWGRLAGDWTPTYFTELPPDPGAEESS